MLSAALIGVIAVALSAVIGGPMTVLVERQQARAAGRCKRTCRVVVGCDCCR